jgi:beta-galactosidase
VAARPPATIAIVQPAPPVYRSTFNGLAQVIVQSTGAPGDIALEATGAGVSRARLVVTAKP